MKQSLKPTWTKMIILLVFFAICKVNVFSRIYANGGRLFFEEPVTTYSKMDSSESLESLIINGAGFFLESNSEFLKFLYRVELTQDIYRANYLEMQVIINKSIENMTQARDTYSALVVRTRATPYNMIAIDRLIDFDYDLFRKERALSGTAIDRLQHFLQKGDVRAVFSDILTDTEKILKGLYSIRGSVDAGNFPLINNLWRINQQFTETMLFGQYAAEVFQKIDK